ncbi:MAG: glutaredoxin family protein [Methylobacter sp.]
MRHNAAGPNPEYIQRQSNIVSAFALTSAAVAEIHVSLPAQGVESADIEAFVRDGCPHCAKAEVFLQALKREQPALKIIVHEVTQDPAALEQLQHFAKTQGTGTVRVAAFQVRGQLIIGYSDETTTGRLIRDALTQSRPTQAQQSPDSSGSCEAEQALSCEAPSESQPPATPAFSLDFLGRKLSLDEVGLPLFTLSMGLLDGFNPCSLWVLILMISLLAPMNNRLRILAIAGLGYFVFMTAWLNLFLLIGLSRISEIVIAIIALAAGLINLKDFRFYGRGVSLSISDSAKPGIYAGIRRILHAQNLLGALVGSVILAVLVQLVEFICTSGFPALYTKILTLKQLVRSAITAIYCFTIWLICSMT